LRYPVFAVLLLERAAFGEDAKFGPTNRKRPAGEAERLLGLLQGGEKRC
jgi:hypothetical protein